MNHPVFEIVKTTAGAISIKNKIIGEIMHNPVGPWQEANELYIEQSGLKEQLNADIETELVVYDVGLGAAANALAALHCSETSRRPMRLISFEKDMTLLKFALANSDQFAHFKGYEEAISTLINESYWERNNAKWTLFDCDFLDGIDRVEHKADLVFYDPYSMTMNSEMWTTACFQKLRAQCNDCATFYNYSQATPVRAALLEAGFFVGYGVPTGYKEATTQAACRLENLKRPLDQRWLDRWKRSHTQLPPECKNPEALKLAILNHQQFLDLNKR